MNQTPSLTLRPIGRLHTPYADLADCPRGTAGDAEGTIEIFPEFAAGLDGTKVGDELYALAWFHAGDRDTLSVIVPHDGIRRGVFACRAPGRPNPVALIRVRVRGIGPGSLRVSGLDCLDGTALVDLKPRHGPARRDRA